VGLTIVVPPLLIPFLIIRSRGPGDETGDSEVAHARTTERKLRAAPGFGPRSVLGSRGGPQAHGTI